MRDLDAQVIVIGAGIAGLACAHRLQNAGVDVLVLESAGQPGGKIRTITREGYQFEAGPNTLIANRPAMLDLIHEAALGPEIIDGSPVARNRWITMGGRLCPLPTSPVGALSSPLIGAGALARALGDLFIRRPAGADDDETVAAFIRRRFGPRILDNLVAPFLSGIYAGDPERLEARSILPTLVGAEAARGSVIRGLIAQRRLARRSGARRLPMRSITLRAGLQALPQRIAGLLGPRLRLSTHVERLSEDGGGITVTLGTGERLSARHAVIAGGLATAGLLRVIDGGEELGAALGAIPHAGLAMVGLGFDRAAIAHRLDGFGYLNGPGAPGPVLGCLFRSSVFPHAAPAGKALLVAFIGGARFPGHSAGGEADLVQLARGDLARTLEIFSAPEMVFVHRWPSAVPQYERGHARLVATLRDWSRRRPISVIGSLVTGVSLNDCVTAGRDEADRLGALLGADATIERSQPCLSA